LFNKKCNILSIKTLRHTSRKSIFEALINKQAIFIFYFWQESLVKRCHHHHQNFEGKEKE